MFAGLVVIGGVYVINSFHWNRLRGGLGIRFGFLQRRAGGRGPFLQKTNDPQGRYNRSLRQFNEALYIFDS